MSRMWNFERNDCGQDEQYDFPYHHIPQVDGGHFSQHVYWSWGFRYLGGLELVFDLLKGERFACLLDVGCGDGRLLLEAKKRYPDASLSGLDVSERAIFMAKAIVPGVQFTCADVADIGHDGTPFDVVTLVEVLEHIPPDRLSDFVASVLRLLKSGGRLIITVPHINKTLQKKHHQHFTSTSLVATLGGGVTVERLVYCDRRSRIFERIVPPLLRNPFFILNNRTILDYLFRMYRRSFFFCNEDQCGRIGFVGRKL